MPLHVPAPAHVTLLEQRGAAQVGAQYGAQGLQLTGAYQAAEHLVLRGSVLAADLGFTYTYSTRHYFQVSLGAGAVARHQRLRASFDIDLAGAYVDMASRGGMRDSFLSITIVDYEDGPDTGPLRRKGELWRVAAQADLGYFWDNAAIGAALIGGWEYFAGQDALERTLYEHVIAVQPALFVRVGPKYLRGELQTGLWLHPWSKDLREAEQTLPFVVSLGLVSEF